MFDYQSAIDNVRAAKEYDRLIAAVNDSIEFWRKMWNNFNKRGWLDLKKLAGRFIGEAIAEKEKWLCEKEHYLSIGLKRSEFVKRPGLGESPDFLQE